MARGNLLNPHKARFTVLKPFRLHGRKYEEGALLDALRVHVPRHVLQKLWLQDHLEVLGAPQPEPNDKPAEQPKRMLGRLADRLRGEKEGEPEKEE